MADTSFKKYLEDKIKQYPNLKSEIDKAGRAVKIAHQIYKLRKERGLTQKELAKMIGVSQSNIARIENADYNHYTSTTSYKVAKGLGAPEQTNKPNDAYNSFPTNQNFIIAGVSGEYFLSGKAPFNRDETITLRAVIKNEIIKVSAESKEYKAEANYYLTP